MPTRAKRNGSHPVRTCVGCGQRRSAHELFRCVWRNGRIEVDRHGAGRGAWLCGPPCIQAARKRRGFDRAWRQPVPPAAIDALAADWSEPAGPQHET